MCTPLGVLTPTRGCATCMGPGLGPLDTPSVTVAPGRDDSLISGKAPEFGATLTTVRVGLTCQKVALDEIH